ncbi:hypothetical protein WN55_08926 [Dufourea novaeangliae]|uniref:Uncharacterized protein n=1 Tax=Dufourea novaeangliae TaxID=178035 RepID=A0A154P5B3_DUFNO|nr:hypothetical protein WN55_08926 [Dufourea novaeangliae]
MRLSPRCALALRRRQKVANDRIRKGYDKKVKRGRTEKPCGDLIERKRQVCK